MRSLDNTLALWVSGLLSSEEVVSWASREVSRLEQPPTELLDLLTDGPEKCLKRAQIDFAPRPEALTYVQAFSVRALKVTLGSDQSLVQLAQWASRACMGEDLSHPFVELGYRLDHLIGDCDDAEGAMELLRSELPQLLAHCRSVAAPYIDPEA